MRGLVAEGEKEEGTFVPVSENSLLGAWEEDNKEGFVTYPPLCTLAV